MNDAYCVPTEVFKPVFPRLCTQHPPAQAPPPDQPLFHPLQEEADHMQLRRAAAHRHGDLSPGAAGGGASAAAGGRGAAAHHPAVTHGEMSPSPHTLPLNQAGLPGWGVWTEGRWEEKGRCPLIILEI